MATDKPRRDYSYIRNYHQRNAAIADEKKRKRLLAENNQTYIKYVLEAKERQRGSKRESNNDARDRAHGRVVRATQSAGGAN
jgi:hypothetical protein